MYYNDINKKIKIFAGLKDDDKKPQDEFSISRRKDILFLMVNSSMLQVMV